MVRLKLESLIGMFPLATLSAPDQDITPAETYSKQDIEHGPAEAGGEGHDGVAELGDGDVGDEVAEGVADGEDGQAHDGVGHVEDDGEGFEGADDLGRDGGDPGDADDEAAEAEDGAVGLGAGGWGRGH